MSPYVRSLHQNLYQQMGYYRQLLEWVRKEHIALVQADVKAVQEAVAQKESLIHLLQQAEADRIRITTELSIEWKTPYARLTLSEIIKTTQPLDSKLGEQLQSAYNALKVLVERVSFQNKENGALLEHSIRHVETMKKNVLGEPIQKSDTYTSHGHKKPSQPSSRFLTQEG